MAKNKATKGKKGVSFLWRPLLIAIPSALVLFLVYSLIGEKSVAYAEGLVQSAKELAPWTEENQCRSQPGHFWCAKAKERTRSGKTEYKPNCLEVGERGKKGENCDPRNYNPINYKEGEYDICTETCEIAYCDSGKGRIGNSCEECSHLGNSCEGGVVFGWFSSKPCCAQEQLECKGGVAGHGKTCQLKANIKATGLTTPTQGSW